MNAIHASLGLGLMVCASLANAQPESPVGSPPEDMLFFDAAAPPMLPFVGPIQFVAGEGNVPGVAVVGKPYSAEAITETVQTLADGNRISQRHESRMFRDSAGRTRQEQTLGGLGGLVRSGESATLVTINDPVAEQSYVLDPKARTARQLPTFKLATGQLGGRVSAPYMRLLRGPAVVDAAAVPGEPSLPSPPGAAVVSAPLPEAQGVRLGGFRVAAGSVSVAGPVAGAATPLQTSSEDLGDQVIQGVLAHGTKRTQTIAAGVIGNERAIEIVAEIWYSNDIEATVLRRHYDPRFGETVYRLINVDRSEPPESLFLVPQGYDLQQLPGPELSTRSPAPGSAAANGALPQQRVFLVQP